LLPVWDEPAASSALPPDSGDESPVDPDDATTRFDPVGSPSSPFATPLGPAAVELPPLPAGWPAARPGRLGADPVAFPEEAKAPVFPTAATDPGLATGAVKELTALLDS